MNEDILGCNRQVGELMQVSLCGISHCDGSYSIRRQNSDVHVFEYIIRGKGTVVRNGAEFTAGAGDAYWLRSGDSHYYFSSKEEPWEKIWFNIGGPYVEALRNIFPCDRTVFPACDAYALFREFISLVCGDLSSPMAAVFAGQKLLELVSYLTYYQSGQFMDDAEALRAFLDERLRQRVGLPEMAAFLCRSPSQLNRIFLKKYGMTPTRYLAQQKVALAKTLLRNTSLSVRQVSDQLCFTDEHYFSNVFQKNVGLRPREYRRKTAAGSPQENTLLQPE